MAGRAGVRAALVALAVTLAGCASTVAEIPSMTAPAGAPARPAQPGEYLPVHDLPASRSNAALSAAEQAKIEAELTKARDRQAVTTPAAKSTTR